MKVLELGNFIVPAYAGMLLSRHGHRVEKWTSGTDPILSLDGGDELWTWLNRFKTLVRRHYCDVPSMLAAAEYDGYPFDAVIDNLKPTSFERHGLDPGEMAARYDVRWVSMRAEKNANFDPTAPAKFWLHFAPWVPFYVGDTAFGATLAFKVLAATQPGHYVLGDASCRLIR